MPTNFVRTGKKAERGNERPVARPVIPADRRIVIVLGHVRLDVELAVSATADRFALSLPIYSKVEPWGEAVHFETHLRSGRDRGARLNAVLGEVYYWSDDGRVIIPFGATPISRPGEIRLPRPCNVLGRVIGDVAALRDVRPTEKVSVLHVQTQPAAKGGGR